MEINAQTLIDKGFPLSRSFNLEHVSSGAYNQMLGQWLPKFSAKIIPRATGQFGFNGNIPLWKVVSNLQSGAEGLLERYVDGFGGNLQIMAGFLNNVSKTNLESEIQHLAGASFDIQVSGYQGNMYNVAKEIQKLSRGASTLELIHSTSSSWVHIGFDKKALSDSIKVTPEFTTRDLVAGVSEVGLTSLRGFV